MPEGQYVSHSDDTCFGKRYDQESLKKVLGINLFNRDTATKKFQKSNKNWKRELKLPRK